MKLLKDLLGAAALMLCLPSAAALVGAGPAHAQITANRTIGTLMRSLMVTLQPLPPNPMAARLALGLAISPARAAGPKSTQANSWSRVGASTPRSSPRRFMKAIRSRVTAILREEKPRAPSRGSDTRCGSSFRWDGSHGTGTSIALAAATAAMCSTTLRSSLRSAVRLAGMVSGVVYNNGLMQSQRFLSTGGSSYAINTVYDIQIYHANSAQNGPGNYVTVVVNGTTVINGYVDNTCSGGPCMFGGGWTIGPYEEAATVIWSYLYGTRL